jgi:MerR family transcriptional regulator, heat shock protein HspR
MEGKKARMKRKDDASATALAIPSARDTSIHLDKPIYTLSVASEILATHPRTLMMYEHLNMIKPKRTVTNRRRYSQRDLMKLQAIQTLTRKHGVNLAGVRYILALLKTLQLSGLELPDGLKELDVSLLDV